jgi:hypothetical protein
MALGRLFLHLRQQQLNSNNLQGLSVHLRDVRLLFRFPYQRLLGTQLGRYVHREDAPPTSKLVVKMAHLNHPLAHLAKDPTKHRLLQAIARDFMHPVYYQLSPL